MSDGHGSHAGLATRPDPPVRRGVDVGRLLLGWVAGLVVLGAARLAGAEVVFALAVDGSHETPTVTSVLTVAAVEHLLDLLAVLLEVGAVLLVLAAGGRAAGRPWWHWALGAVVPVGVLHAVVALGAVVDLGLPLPPLGVGWALVLAPVAAGVAVGAGEAVRRVAVARSEADAGGGHEPPRTADLRRPPAH